METTLGIFKGINRALTKPKENSAPRTITPTEAVYQLREKKTRTLDVDISKLQDPEYLNYWTHNVFLGGGSAIMEADIPQFEDTQQTLRDLTKLIAENAEEIKFVQSALHWEDSGAGVTGVGPNKLLVRYKNGTHASLRWNPGSFGRKFLHSTLDASGRIREIIEQNYPEFDLNGIVPETEDIFDSPVRDLRPKAKIVKPAGPEHPSTKPEMLETLTTESIKRQQLIPLLDYLRDFAVEGKPRGNATSGKEDLNSHKEELIFKEGEEIRIGSLEELQELLTNLSSNIQVLGVSSIGNANQRVTAVVQGVDPNNPKSGFERPTVAEGPHMILAPFAVDKNGELHLFRTIQMRTGEAVIDTPRGFADTTTLENGEQMYDLTTSGEKVDVNMQRVLGEEAGTALKIKRVLFLGSPRVNSSFVTSKSAVFGVEVDYDAFISAQKVVTQEELARRQEQFEHEGLVGDILDITLPQYVEYKRDSDIAKDMAADFGTDTVVIDFLETKLSEISERDKKYRDILKRQSEKNRRFKKEDPEGYVRHMLDESKYRHPERYDENKRRAEEYLSTLYRQGLNQKDK